MGVVQRAHEEVERELCENVAYRLERRRPDPLGLEADQNLDLRGVGLLDADRLGQEVIEKLRK